MFFLLDFKDVITHMIQTYVDDINFFFFRGLDHYGGNQRWGDEARGRGSEGLWAGVGVHQSHHCHRRGNLGLYTEQRGSCRYGGDSHGYLIPSHPMKKENKREKYESIIPSWSCLSPVHCLGEQEHTPPDLCPAQLRTLLTQNNEK